MTVNVRYSRFKVDLGHDYDVGELADVLVQARTVQPEMLRSHLSDKALEELLRICFHASLRAEEGKYPRFRLFAYPRADKNDELRTIARFEPGIPVDTESLRKVAAAFPPEDTLLVVTEGQDGLQLTSAISPFMAPVDGRDGEPRIWRSGRIPGLEVAVSAPADLRVWEELRGLHCRAGRLREIVPFESELIGADWMRRLGEGVVRRAAVATGIQDAEKNFGGHHVAAELLASILNRALGVMVRAGHGGALIMCPGPIDSLVDIGRAVVDLDIGATVERYWEQAVRLRNGDQGAAHMWGLERRRLSQQATRLGQLANVDGCVVLTERFEVLGFGCKLRPSKSDAEKSRIAAWNLLEKRPWDDQSGNNLGGMRHLSAFRFVKCAADASAYVVSQDGDLTLFASTSDRAYCLRGLWPGQLGFG